MIGPNSGDMYAQTLMSRHEYCAAGLSQRETLVEPNPATQEQGALSRARQSMTSVWEGRLSTNEGLARVRISLEACLIHFDMGSTGENADRKHPHDPRTVRSTVGATKNWGHRCRSLKGMDKK